MATSKDPKAKGGLLTAAQRTAMKQFAATLTPIKVDPSMRPRP